MSLLTQKCNSKCKQTKLAQRQLNLQTSEAHPIDWIYPAGLKLGADTHEECRKLYSGFL